MKKSLILLMFPLLGLFACTNDDPNPEPGESNDNIDHVDGEGETPDYETPTFSYEIPAYNGEKAAEEPSYETIAGDPEATEGINPEATDWDKTVTVTYNGNSAEVSCPQGVTSVILGANIEIKLGTTKRVKIIASGSSDDGSLTISGSTKHMLELDNLTLKSTSRPAINDQAEKRVFVMLKGHSRLEDGSNYDYNSTPKRKGCFYAAEHVILCGDGILEVKGNNRHGFATDGFLLVNPGATLVVTDAKKNAIHVDGAGIANNYRGIEVLGGYVYAHTSADAGKAMKCDTHIRLRGGRLNLSASGSAAIDPTDNTLSSPACIKSDSTVTISGGEILLTTTGTGAKGITSDFDMTISGGTLTIANSGTATVGGGDSSTPKALNAHGNLTISAGSTYISSIGAGSTAVSSDANFLMSGGNLYAFGANFGIKALSAKVEAGTMLCGGTQNTAVEGAETHDYENLEAEEVSVELYDSNGDPIPYRWPIALAKAQLLTR